MSREELLTRKQWKLKWKNTSDIANKKYTTKTQHYKTEDHVLVFDFKKNGTVNVIENYGIKDTTISWQWVNDDRISLKYLDETNEFAISELNKDTLSLCKIFAKKGKCEYLYFKN